MIQICVSHHIISSYSGQVLVVDSFAIKTDSVTEIMNAGASLVFCLGSLNGLLAEHESSAVQENSRGSENCGSRRLTRAGL